MEVFILTKRIITNLISEDNLKAKLNGFWNRFFNENGVADVRKILNKVPAKYVYEWIYQNTNIDLIGWQIQNNCFDWDKYEWVVKKYCPEYIKYKPQNKIYKTKIEIDFIEISFYLENNILKLSFNDCISENTLPISFVYDINKLLEHRLEGAVINRGKLKRGIEVCACKTNKDLYTIYLTKTNTCFKILDFAIK